MGNQLAVNYSKTLRLNNVLLKEINDEDMENLQVTVEKMESYLKANGAMPIGPLIQCSKLEEKDDQLELKIYLLRQANNFLHSVEQPYQMESVIRVKNCMYCHYIGPEGQLNLASAKLSVIAFEEEIKLKGNSYVVFVDQNEDTMVADVFMEREADE